MLTFVWTLWFAQLQMNLGHRLKTLSLDQQYVPQQTLKKLEEICWCLSPDPWVKMSALFFVDLFVLFFVSLSALIGLPLLCPWLICPSFLLKPSARSPRLHSLVDFFHPLQGPPFLYLSLIYLFSHLQFQAAKKKDNSCTVTNCWALD